MKMTTFTGKSIGKIRDKITKADINGKNIKNLTHRKKTTTSQANFLV